MKAPLQSSTEIVWGEAEADQIRRYRLTHAITLPSTLIFAAALPIEGKRHASVRFKLPNGYSISADAMIHFDPERADDGSRAELLNLPPVDQLAIEAYVESRLKITT